MDLQAQRPDKAGRFSLSGHRRVLDHDDVDRALKRISHEIVERNRGTSKLLIVGIEHGGVWLANEIGKHLSEIGAGEVPVIPLDVSNFRDDRASSSGSSGADERRENPLASKTVVLVDDVLFTGRTVRAALEAIMDYGRPDAIQLAVLVDRGHRELPIRADYVGKNLPTSSQEVVLATASGVAIGVLSE